MQQKIVHLGCARNARAVGAGQASPGYNWRNVTRTVRGGALDSLFDAAEGGESRERRLEELALQVSVCTKCDLAKSRTNTVFATGDPYSPLMLVGEGPGENEDATGLPFVGRAGKLLD
ncbi:MAG TPA: uracil-DNA glycosylase family protein, partial [Rubrobacter sp.]|nr:uracil-DNA glycosylase family protein [Rubrobacter sp.]